MSETAVDHQENGVDTEPSEAPQEGVMILLSYDEAQMIYTMLEKIPVNGPQGKIAAASVQQKIINAASMVG